MKLIISFCAPAVMESMATTAPTPKIMPSMVSKLRSLCAKRLASPIFNSGRMCEMPMLFASRHTAHGAGGGRFLVGGLLGLVGGGVREGDDFSRLHAGSQYHQRFALLLQLHFARFKLAVLLLHVYSEFPVSLEDRLSRNVQDIGNLLDHDLHIRQKTRPQQRLYL